MTLREEMEQRLCQLGLPLDVARVCMEVVQEIHAEKYADFKENPERYTRALYNSYGEDCWDRENPWFLKNSDFIFKNDVLKVAFPWLSGLAREAVHRRTNRTLSVKEEIGLTLTFKFGLDAFETQDCLLYVAQALAKDKTFTERFGSDCLERDISQFTSDERFRDIYGTFVLPEAFKWLISRFRTEREELDMQGTVKGTIKEALRATCQMREEDASRCMEFALQELNQNNPIDEHGGLKRKDGQSIKVSECWKTAQDEYADGELVRLQHEVERKALQWYVKCDEVQRTALQEFHRLSVPLEEQETAE